MAPLWEFGGQRAFSAYNTSHMGHNLTGTRVGAQGTPSLLPGLLHSDLITEAGGTTGWEPPRDVVGGLCVRSVLSPLPGRTRPGQPPLGLAPAPLIEKQRD